MNLSDWEISIGLIVGLFGCVFMVCVASEMVEALAKWMRGK